MKLDVSKTRRNSATRQRGFTLVEMLLVLVILATLAAVVVPKFAGRSKQAKVTAAKSQISNLEIAIDSFSATKESSQYNTINATVTKISTLHLHRR